MSAITPVARRESPVSLPSIEEEKSSWKPHYNAYWSASSIAPAQEKDSFALSGTREPAALCLIRTLERIEGLNGAHTLWTEEQIRDGQAEIRKLHTVREEALREHLAALSQEKSWSLLGSLIHYFSSAASLLVGILLLRQGVDPKKVGLLLASGAVGAGVQAAHDTGLWEKLAGWLAESAESKERIQARLEAGSYFLSLALAATSFWNTGWTSIDQALQALGVAPSLQKASAVLFASTIFFQGVAQIGMGMTEKQLAEALVKGKAMQAEIQKIYRSIQQKGEKNKEALDFASHFASSLSRAIEESAQATQKD